MATYSYTMNTSGVSPAIIQNSQSASFQMFAKQPEDSVLGNVTFQIITTSASSGTVQITFDGSNWTDIYTFTSTGSESEILVYEGKLKDFRLNVTSGNVTLKGMI